MKLHLYTKYLRYFPAVWSHDTHNIKLYVFYVMCVMQPDFLYNCFLVQALLPEGFPFHQFI